MGYSDASGIEVFNYAAYIKSKLGLIESRQSFLYCDRYSAASVMVLYHIVGAVMDIDSMTVWILISVLNSICLPG